MIPERLIAGRPATLEQILARREARAAQQRELLRSGGESLVSFSMNIPGACKRFALEAFGFQRGCGALREAFGGCILSERSVSGVTGDELLLLLALDPMEAKKRTVALEQTHPLGRLWDMDVLDAQGNGISRAALGVPPRSCLICGENAKACGRSRRHAAEEVFARVCALLAEEYRQRSAEVAADCAARALRTEVSVTPKPGLVDRQNNGSHADMDYAMFLASADALTPWFRVFYETGWANADAPVQRLFDRLRRDGLEAERAMFAATGGVNTHKGLVFSMALVCGALGASHAGAALPLTPDELMEKVRALGACALDDLTGETQNTAGERCYAAYRIPGARGQAAAGYPAVLSCALPTLDAWLARRAPLNDAAAAALVALIAQVEDTNMIHRGGLELAQSSRKQAARVLAVLTQENLHRELAALDRAYIQKNLSPGGCADLLALALLIHFLREQGILAF